ncbi:MAG: LysR substrate-binding domain-containing protein [Alphaproteobacteria bacterium]
MFRTGALPRESTTFEPTSRGGIAARQRSDRLFFEELFPVCSPKLLEGAYPIRTPADLRRHTLLHLEGETRDETWPDWRMWLSAAGCADIDATPGPRFTQSMMLVQAAIEGHGVALGPRAIVADDLAAGRLARPFADAYSTRTAFAYYVASPEATVDRPKVAAFREWVLAEARTTPASHVAALSS